MLNFKAMKFYLDCLTSGKFDELQLNQIHYGLKTKLPLEQVSFYANPKYNNRQMSQIYTGFQNGLTLDQVKMYAHENLHYLQMTEIRLGIENGLTNEQIGFYMNKNFDWFQSSEIRLGFEHGLTTNQIKIYAHPKFNKWQMEQIRVGLEHRLVYNQIILYANELFDGFQMKAIREELEKGASLDEIKGLMTKSQYVQEPKLMEEPLKPLDNTEPIALEAKPIVEKPVQPVVVESKSIEKPLKPLDIVMQTLNQLSIEELKMVKAAVTEIVPDIKRVPLETLEKPKKLEKTHPEPFVKINII